MEGADLAAIRTLMKDDPELALVKLRKIIEKEKPFQGALTAAEYDLYKKWEDWTLPDDQVYLTGIETRQLISAWYKMDRARGGAR